MRIHRKVWLWWGRWWAVQFYRMWDEWSVGVRINWRQPVLDVYAGPLTIALGVHPEITLPRDAQRFSCRGFVISDRPVL